MRPAKARSAADWFAAHADANARRREEERQREIVEMFDGLAELGPDDETHDWDHWGDPEEPLPTETEPGRRYCHRCGVKKRTKSFDAVDGKLAEACRACSGGPKATARAA